MVVATPEEIVRQKILQLMTKKLGFPKELLAVEKQLRELPHLQNIDDLPNRRADIICFARKKHTLFPLLLIECKEDKITPMAKSQVLGYNHYVQAFFVAIAGKNAIQLIYPQELDFLPHYDEMLEVTCP